jgi:hypothetical protein
MTTPTPQPEPTREQLRQQWLAAAGDAFDRMFDAREQDQLVTFAQREDRAVVLGHDLAAWLLERHLSNDPHATPDLATPPPCPKCGRPGQPRPTPNGRPPRRRLQTEVGTVEWTRQRWRCATCRVAFFPARPTAATGDGGL